MNAKTSFLIMVFAFWPPTIALGGGVPPANANLISYDQSPKGFLYKPDGPGPFPAVVWNHGSEELPGWQPELAKFYVDHGYVFFIPHRSGQGRSPGKYIVELPRHDEPAGQVELLEGHNRDVVAAVSWLKTQPFVDALRIVMSGVSYGGIETILTAEKGLGIRAFIPFAPGAMAWAGNPLLAARLTKAVKAAKAPMFLIQAQNDYSLEPSRVLGGELRTKGSPNRATLYPQFGTGHQGHGFFATTSAGIEVWGPDVLEFLEQTNEPSSR